MIRIRRPVPPAILLQAGSRIVGAGQRMHGGGDIDNGFGGQAGYRCRSHVLDKPRNHGCKLMANRSRCSTNFCGHVASYLPYPPQPSSYDEITLVSNLENRE
jgi:hypothetical protein